jgi:hypothetical protein
MSDVGDLFQGLAAAMWVFLALVVFLVFRRPLLARIPHVTKLGLGATGVTMEFAEQKLAEAATQTGLDEGVRRSIGEATTKALIHRLDRNADLVKEARILWVDDRPENNVALVELLRKMGARIDTPQTNDDAFALLRSPSNRYDVIISDVGRDVGPDSEDERSDLKGVDFAEDVFGTWGQRPLLFVGLFDPTTLPHKTTDEKLEVTRLVDLVTFGRTNRYDEVLHMILDMLERARL